jgi:protein-L-isoaspartate(D-aspartate) O-methyltransferase
MRLFNIVTRYGDGTKGWEEESPFDAIIVTAGAPVLPAVLLSQLAVGGRLVVPIGNQHTQDLIRIIKDERGVRETNLGGCRFVKLVGEQGWKEI